MALYVNDAIELLTGRTNLKIQCILNKIIITTHDGHLVSIFIMDGKMCAEVVYEQEEVN